MSFTFSDGMPRFSVLFFLMKDQNCLGFFVKLSPIDVIYITTVGVGDFFGDFFP